jgi:hypothetical protein
MKLAKLEFPNWPMQRLLAEACLSHDCLHPLDRMDPETSDWQKLYSVTISFLRHQVTTYDECLRAGYGDRDQLHREISAQARKTYPWLRQDKDPRVLQRIPTDKPEKFKIFDELSRYSCDLRSIRAQLLVARRKCMPKTDRQLLDADLREVNRWIDWVDTAFKPPIELPPEHKDLRVLLLDHEGDYYFAGRQLPFNYLESTTFNCEACAKRVWRMKMALDLGSNSKLVVFACHCVSLSIASSYTGGVNSKLWQRLAIAEN